MQTTLRINDHLYREAKAEAARQGKTITRFIEEALELRLKQQPAKNGPVTLPTFSSPAGFDFSPSQLKDLARTSETQRDLAKLTER